MSSNKLDPIHAVASLSLAFIEAQKDISQMRRQIDVLYNQIQTIDQATATKFKELDVLIDKLFRSLEGLLVKKEETSNAANIERKEDSSLDEKAVRGEEG